MDSRYHEGNRRLQDEQGTRALADRLDERNLRDHLDPDDQAFVAERDMFFLATVDPGGRPTCSYKGGDPGFVRVLDERTLAFPNYDGNGMYLSWGNVLENPRVGLLFIDWQEQRRLRVEGAASIDRDDPLIADWPEAQFVVRVTTDRVYPNCPRYIHQMETVERSRFVPRAGAETPVPGWKARFADVLPP